MSTDNIYQITLKKILDLYKVNNKKEALKLVDEELGMPYTPKEYLRQFQNWKVQLEAEIKVDTSAKTKSKPELLEQLLSPNLENILDAINALHEFRIIQEDYSIIQQVLKKPSIPKVYKALLFQLLVQQKINYDFQYLNNEIIIINPTTIKTLKSDQKFVETVKLLENQFIKNPSNLEFAMQFCVYYFMAIFPNITTLDTSIIVKSISEYTNHVLANEQYDRNAITKVIEEAIKENTNQYIKEN